MATRLTATRRRRDYASGADRRAGLGTAGRRGAARREADGTVTRRTGGAENGGIVGRAPTEPHGKVKLMRDEEYVEELGAPTALRKTSAA